MSHEVQYFCNFTSAPEQVLEETIRSVLPLVGEPADRQQGATWVSASFGRSSWEVTVEVHRGDETTAAAVESITEEASAPDLIDVNGLILLTLTGAVDETLVRSLRDLFIDRWRGLEFDEVGGFTSP